MTWNTNIYQMMDARDIEGLIRILRSTEKPAQRERAANALEKIGDLRAVESLIRAYLQDPAQEVQQAAYDALQSILGGETDTAISAYAIPDDPWQVVEEAVNDEEQDENPDYRQQTGVSTWGEGDIQGLIAIIRYDHDLAKRLKAIYALSQIENTRAIDALASIALWSEERRIREAAKESLRTIYGDDLDEVLQSYRAMATGEEEGQGDGERGGHGEYEDDDELEDEDSEEDDESDEYGDEEEEERGEAEMGENEEEDESDEDYPDEEEPISTPYPPSGSFTGKSSPVIMDAGPGRWTYLLIGLLVLAAVGMLIYFLAQK
jgi:hypothetical protein